MPARSNIRTGERKKRPLFRSGLGWQAKASPILVGPAHFPSPKPKAKLNGGSRGESPFSAPLLPPAGAAAAAAIGKKKGEPAAPPPPPAAAPPPHPQSPPRSPKEERVGWKEAVLGHPVSKATTAVTVPLVVVGRGAKKSAPIWILFFSLSPLFCSSVAE